MALSAGKWHERRLPSLLKSLDLYSEEFHVHTDAVYFQVLGTVLEELAEDSVSFSPSQGASQYESLLNASGNILESLGYPGHVPRSRSHALSLLLCELQISRAVASGKQSADDPADVRVANAVSRIQLSSQANTEDTPMAGDDDIVELISNIDVNKAPKCTAPLVPYHELTAGQKSQLDSISNLLHSEYLQRRELLVQRLRVTARAFAPASSRAASAASARAASVSRAVISIAPAPPRYSISHAYIARAQYRKRAPGVAADKVRAILMGSVPDRGGRVGKIAETMSKLNMPQFQTRKG